MMRTKIKKIFEKDITGTIVTVCGWVKTIRSQKTFTFIELNDGSSFSNIQIIVDSSIEGYSKLEGLTTGASISVDGKVVNSPGKNQKYEIHASTLEVLGRCDGEDYPLQKKRHTFEFLRTIAHLRPRTNTQGAVTRIRNALAFATHKFFQENDFLYIAAPIITSSDCEGGGEMFRVTTLGDKDSPRLKDNSLDFLQDFFGRATYLTVSGQLNAETYACALSDVYTFGPTFRAENSNTSRHLAEFWMIEPEMAFCDLNQNKDVAQRYLKYIIKFALDNCQEDLEFADKFIENGLIKKLTSVVETPFQTVTYTDAIKILEQSSKKFEYPVKWGCDLQSEHERFLAEEHFKSPVAVINYPASIKAFYMRQNDDDKTVAAMDLLVPKIGELIGGAQREERFERLKDKINKIGLKEKDYWWYLELRKYGTVPHSGFGLGFERLVQFVTGMENIRDVIPFPRYPGHAEF